LDAVGAQSGSIEDEPEKDAETVLTVRLTVASDLEPSWSLVSERAEAQGMVRNLNWGDRVRLAPTRIGAMADYHLGWRRGSVLNHLSEEPVDASVALAKAARGARAVFGNEAQSQLGETLGIVAATAKELGISVGENIKALLDAHSVSFSGGTISLHDEVGIPLRALGVGSTRLLIAGLQRKAAAQSAIILIDELEHGLEPHRIIRLLGSLGAKETNPPLQVFMTTHSPVALRELAGGQLFVTRPLSDKHDVFPVGTTNDIQGTIRLYPDAFLARSVIVCEGASEVGFVRGLDQFRTLVGNIAIAANGTSLVDCGGGGADKPFERAKTFLALGYRSVVLRDSDQAPTEAMEATFIAAGGKVFAWRDGRALEDELFLSLSNNAVAKLIDRAIELHGEERINEQIKSASQNVKDLHAIQREQLFEDITTESRAILRKASKGSRANRNGWFKSITWMEEAARDIVGPDLVNADMEFRALVNDIFEWASNAGE
jgi:putative ATP-dependent endonuclease of OLD family